MYALAGKNQDDNPERVQEQKDSRVRDPTQLLGPGVAGQAVYRECIDGRRTTTLKKSLSRG